MTTIRPALPTAVAPNPAPKASDPARAAAAKAFFQIAAGQAAAAAPPSAAPPAAEARATAGLNRIAEAPAEKPARSLRPGSILDIRV